jgi:nitrate/nitrite transporter NarK
VLALGGANFVILGGYYCFNLSAPSFLRSEAQLRPAAVGWLVATGGLLAAAAMLGWARSSDLARERFVHLAAPMILMAVAFAALSWPLAPVAVMIAYVSAVILNGALGGVFWPTPGELLDPRAASVGVAAINAIGQVGSFVAPVLWGMAKDRTGDYRLGLRVLPFAFLIGAILVLWLRTHVRARDRAAA